MAPESMAQESERRECETLNAWETEYYLKVLRSKHWMVFSNDPNNLFSLSISSLNSPCVRVSFSSFGGLLLVRFACP